MTEEVAHDQRFGAELRGRLCKDRRKNARSSFWAGGRPGRWRGSVLLAVGRGQYRRELRVCRRRRKCLEGAHRRVGGWLATTGPPHPPGRPLRYARPAFRGAIADERAPTRAAVLLEFGERGWRSCSALSLVGSHRRRGHLWLDGAPARRRARATAVEHVTAHRLAHSSHRSRCIILQLPKTEQRPSERDICMGKEHQEHRNHCARRPQQTARGPAVEGH